MNTSTGPEKGHLLVDSGRRDFLSIVALTGASSFLPFLFNACSKTEQFTGTGKAPFKVWEEMLQAIMTSSDYLPGRMKKLVASNNTEAMYNFVKDEIILTPPESHRLTGMGTKTKWGIPSVLRSGMATPREKAELLHAMYQKAGIESKIVFERTNIKPEQVPAFFYRPITRNFDPIISKSQFQSWENEMGAPKESMNKKDIQKDYSIEANALGERILNNINSIEKYAQEFDFRWDNYHTPTVEFIEEGATKYAHLFDPDIAFGKLKNDNGGKLSDADPIEENKEEITIRLSYRNTIDPKREREFVSGKWVTKDVIGKQVVINFLHGLTLEEQVVTPIGNVRTFTPALALQAIDENVAYMSERSFLGDPFTIDGKIIKLAHQEKAQVDGNVFINKSNPELQKTVTDLNTKASTGGYPIVKLNITAKDSTGNFVEGLSPKDFLITEDDIPVRALMENNQRTPKILILSDASGSMPEPYFKERMNDFNEKLKNSILEKYPSAVVDFWKTPSSLFTWLLKASQTSYDLVIYATDGDNDDDYDPKKLPIYQAGPPTLILNVKNSTSHVHLGTFDKMAEITNGNVIDAKDQVQVLKEIAEKIDALEIPPYVFSYASADKSKKHTVEVNIDNSRLTSEASYQFPESASRGTNGIIGIYLELNIGNNKPIHRVLAGWDHKNELYHTNKDHALAVEGLLFGKVMLAIEGEGPTLSMALSELLKSKLSNRSWGEAYLDKDITKAKEALAKGAIHVPALLIPMMSPLQDQVTNESMTFASGYKMCLVKTIVGINQPTISSFDYLPTSKYVSMAKNKTKTITTTVLKTAQLAIREATLFQNSTYSLLENTKWINKDVAVEEKWLKNTITYENGDYRYWNETVFRGNENIKLFDRTADTKAFWKINKRTGELYGIMPDGSGGGFNRFEDQLEELDEIIDMYSKIFDAMGVGSTPIGIVTTYGKTLVKLYAIVSEVIIVMDASGMDEAIKEALMGMACEIAKDIVKEITGEAGEIMGGLDQMIGLMAGDENNPFSCS